MKTYITRLCGYNNGAESLRQNIVSEYAQEVNILPISLFHYPAENEPENQINSRLDGILSGITFNDTIIVQTPISMSENYVQMLLNKLTALRNSMGLKLISFIHDPEDEMINFYNQCDGLIIENKLILNELQNHGLTNKIVNLFNFYDFSPTLAIHSQAKFSETINFLNGTNSDQLLDEIKKETVDFNLYQDHDLVDDQSLHYAGPINDDLLVNRLNKTGGFGLVWSDDKNMVPIELSMYVSAGIPVIAFDNTAAGNLVSNKKIGWVVNSLEEATNRLQATLEIEYNQLRDHVEKMAIDTRNGISIKNALIRAIFDANISQVDKAGE